jgi:hypothetical protein
LTAIAPTQINHLARNPTPTQNLNRRTVAAVLEEPAGVFVGNRRDRYPDGLQQGFSATHLELAYQVLYLAEGLPTFICIVRAHILDDAQRGRGWFAKACHSMALEE